MSAARLAKCVLSRSVVRCAKTRSCHRILSIRPTENSSYVQTKRLLSTTKCLCKETEDGNNSDVKIPAENIDAPKDTADISAEKSETVDIAVEKSETVDIAAEKSETVDIAAEKNEPQKETLDVSADKSVSDTTAKKKTTGKKKPKASAKKAKPQKETSDAVADKTETLGIPPVVTESEKKTDDVSAEKSETQKIIKSKPSNTLKSSKTDGDEEKKAAESTSSSDSDSDSESSSDSESDVERTKKKPKLNVDPIMEAAADQIVELLPGNKEKRKTELLGRLNMKNKTEAPGASREKKDKKGSMEKMSTQEAEKLLMDMAFTDDSTVDEATQRRALLTKMKSVPIVQKLMESDDRPMDSDTMDTRMRDGYRRDGPENRRGGGFGMRNRDGFEDRRNQGFGMRNRDGFEDRRNQGFGMKNRDGFDDRRREGFGNRNRDGFEDRRRDSRDNRGRENFSYRRSMAQADTEAREKRDGEPVEDIKTLEKYRNMPVIGLFEGEAYGYFKKSPETTMEVDTGKKSLYDIIEEEKREKLLDFEPRNAFEEQIQWTKQGRLWTFPIDNEAGWEEKNVSFQDHVFLDRQIKDFPQKGPIRHFMEIVTVALSKNSYMSVEEKRGHIDWFRNYFKSNEKLLIEQLGDMGKFTEQVDQSSESA